MHTNERMCIVSMCQYKFGRNDYGQNLLTSFHHPVSVMLLCKLLMDNLHFNWIDIKLLITNAKNLCDTVNWFSLINIKFFSKVLDSSNLPGPCKFFCSRPIIGLVLVSMYKLVMSKVPAFVTWWNVVAWLLFVIVEFISPNAETGKSQFQPTLVWL